MKSTNLRLAMKSANIFLMILWAGALSIQAQPDPASVRPITLGEAIQQALENNLDVRIQRIGPNIAESNLRASYSTYDPNFSLTLIHSFNSRPGGFDEEGRAFDPTESENDIISIPGIGGLLPTGTRYSLDAGLFGNEVTRSFAGRTRSDETFSGNWGINLTQPLLRDSWIDAGRMQILVSKKNLAISEEALRGQILQTIASVEQAYYNLIAARENVKVSEKALELAERTLSDNRKRVEVGALAPLEEKEAEAQVASGKADLLGAQRTLALQQNAIKNLLTADFPGMHSVNLLPAENLVAVPQVYDLQDSWQKGLTLRPDILQARVDLERLDVQLRFQKNQLFPALDLVGSYGHNGLNMSFGRVLSDISRDDNPEYSYGIRLSIPLGNVGARNRYKAVQASKEQALLEYKKLEQNIMVQIDDAIKQAQTSFERVSATRQASEFAAAALDAEQKKLENGKSTSFLVLQFQERLTAARFSEISALRDYNNALSQLAFQEGTILQRHQLQLDVR